MDEGSSGAGDLGIVCLGEALVDLICPDRVRDPVHARHFCVHFGGALANVAVAARRAGAPAALAGGCGTDEWGRFLRGRLAAEGVSLELHTGLAEVVTPFAFVTLARDREPAFRIHGDGIEAGITTLAGREEELADRAAALVFGSNTLPEQGSRAVTLAVCEAARQRGVPVLFDPNLRPGRWRERDRARAACMEAARRATVLKCNVEEARWLSGEPGADAAQAAEALTRLGPDLVAVTSGSGPVAVRGACALAAAPPEVTVLSPLGAGDIFMGTLAAELMRGGWDLSAAGPAVAAAAREGAAACTRLGALE